MTIITNHEIEYKDFEENGELLKIMGHPMRLKIINELYKHKMLNGIQITKILNLPQSTVSQHLCKMKGKILKGNRKGLEIYSSINNPKVEKIIALLIPIE
ncbi:MULTISPECIES: ArsR/SmtB family transcription factor [Bacillus]|uniref:Transcriptional repressor PagR n=1 Tax=Bacillus anthracis TaxID=1392 RepID=A0A6L7HRQ7_BACAN|nr:MULTISPECIES: metalloregulator ArsR/SmtB family transcription factor [Bacillus]AAM26225.1 transcriptional repressor PagR, (pXO1-109) [Bacillus anthracis str. A2012]EJT17286.1 Transcriptional repressor PagR [Bacillus anthracis str. UR-1]AAT28999.2 transcriptional repressor PagR [Bacillus anthracis str. 'Ames Ancestor']ACP11970.1 transcriptional repressor PagR [Bacillus anthracis str. CDC 684]ACQ45916.1 transcriptional repressor PagR [Bacillus anthracis str. A0248]